MKAKIYIPIIVAAGAAAGLTLGLIRMAPGGEKKPEGDQTEIAVETTLSAEELAKIEKEKEKEYEEKVKEEEKNAEEFFKKRQEEKKKKEEEEKKKKEEEEKKKKEEEEKKKSEESEEESSSDKNEEEASSDTDSGEEDDVAYEYVYVPVDNEQDTSSSSGNSSTNDNKPATQHTHSWEPVYRTVHHDAETHNEKRKIGTSEKITCTYYGDMYFTLVTDNVPDSFYQVCRLSDGSIAFETNKESEKKDLNYFMSLMRISYGDTAYQFTTQTEDITEDVTVTDKEAYDERVFDCYKCTGCGQTSY